MIILVKFEETEFPEDLYYHKDHMWVKLEEDKARIGYNSWAANAAGKLVSMKTRPEGRSVDEGKSLGSIESGKWVGSLKMPITGQLLEINSELSTNPSLINDDPYGRGWIAIVKPEKLEQELDKLIKGSDIEALNFWLKEEKKKAGV
jgi:glycine cleavage system H protein